MATGRKKTNSKQFLNLKDHPVAVIGLDSIFPDAPNLPSYWQNIYEEVDSIVDVPPSRWNIDEYYDPDPKARDKSYSKRGGFIPDIDFNPMEFGLPPNILEVTDVSQLLSLVVAKRALIDAGYFDASQEKLDRTGVTLGMVGISSKIAVSLFARLQSPIWQRALENVGIHGEEAEHIIEKIKAAYIEFNENSFPGGLGNIVAGRITNRFNLGAMNCTLDAACASALAAVNLAVSELVMGRADLMLTGGVDLDNSMLTYLSFCKTPALSPGDKVRTFDESSNGMLPGEGIGMMVLKRLADAERDGDRIYAVIRGIGASSDGRYKSIYAPRAEGQAKSLRRAYEEAGFAPQTVGLIEAHGTGTPAGDPAEVESLKMVFPPAGNNKPSIALGSVKSQIGHTKAAAGAAGMIKGVLALHHKILPATLNVEKPNKKFGLDESMFYINTETRPWFRKQVDIPRRAGVSAFGFGGTNFHIVLEEYENSQPETYRMVSGAYMILLHSGNANELLKQCKEIRSNLNSETQNQVFTELARHTEMEEVPAGDARLGFAAETVEDCTKLLDLSIGFLEKDNTQNTWEHPKGIFYRQSAMETKGKVVVLFPGQGSQYVNMGRELAMMYPPVRDLFSEMNVLRMGEGSASITDVLYPIPVFSNEEKKAQKVTLTKTENAQPAIGTTSAAMFTLLKDAGLKADFFAGHSFGELTALWAGGVLKLKDYLNLTVARGEAMKADSSKDAGTMLAVKGDADAIIKAVEAFKDVSVANINSHQQVVLSGTTRGIGKAQSALADAGFATIPLSVSAAFHSPLVAHAQKPFAEAIQDVPFHQPHTQVFSNNTTEAYVSDPQEIQTVLAKHMLSTVNFRKEIENLYGAGGRIFIEVGPRRTLTNMVLNILDGKEFIAMAVNSNHRLNSDTQLRQAYVHLKVLGMPLKTMDRWMRWPEFSEDNSNHKMKVTLNGGLYHSEKMKKNYEEIMSDGFKIERVNDTMEDQTQKTNQMQQAAQVNQQQQTAESVSPPAYGYSAALHEKYLQAAQEFNKALAAMTQVEQDLVRLGNQNGNHQHLDLVINRMSRLMDHQETMLNIHLSMLQQTPLSAAPAATAPQFTMPLVKPAAIQPQAPAAFTPAPTVVQKPMVKPVQQGQAKPAPEVIKEAPAQQQEEESQTTINGNGDIGALLLSVVSDKTGYPEETLELEMSMEADLGIDSIKRIEILGAMQEHLPDVQEIDMEELGSLTTLQDVVVFMKAQAGEISEKKA